MSPVHKYYRRLMVATPPRSAGPPARRLCPGGSCVAVVCLMGVLLVGCQSGARNFINDNDKLRSENLVLRRNVEKLEKILDLRVEQVRILEQRLGNPSKASGVEAASLPRVVKVVFGRLSGAVDTDGDGVDDTLRLYTQTLDQLGRFMPTIGPAAIQVVAIEPGKPPVVLASKDYSPNEFAEAYRSGLTGTHFTLEVPLPPVIPEGIEKATVKLVFTDAATGAKHTIEQVMRVRRGGAP